MDSPHIPSGAGNHLCVPALVLAASILLGCNKINQPNGAASDASGAAASSALPAAAFNAEEFRKLSDRVATLESNEKLKSMLSGFDEVAYLTPANKEWSTIKTPLGNVAVSLNNVAEYANGSEIVLQFGNPTSATLSELSAHLEWGHTDANGSPIGQVSEKDVSFNDALAPGSWHNFRVALSGVPPKELGYVRVREFKFKSISLRTAFDTGS